MNQGPICNESILTFTDDQNITIGLKSTASNDNQVTTEIRDKLQCTSEQYSLQSCAQIKIAMYRRRLEFMHSTIWDSMIHQ